MLPARHAGKPDAAVVRQMLHACATQQEALPCNGNDIQRRLGAMRREWRRAATPVGRRPGS